MEIIQTLVKWDHLLYQYINNNLQYPIFLLFFWLITNFADLAIFTLTIAWLSLWAFSGKFQPPRKLTKIITPVFIAAVAGVILKLIIQRQPPIHHLMPWIEIQFPFSPSWYAFPSGHAVRAFALATSLAVFYPQQKWLLAIAAVLIGFSRVYIGAHFPLDVIAGAILGIAVPILFTKLAVKR